MTRPTRPPGLGLALLALLLLLASGCGSSAETTAPGTTAATGGTAATNQLADESTTALEPLRQGGIRIEAAASLTEAFTAIGSAFESDHPGVTVTFDFGPSSGLSDSLVEGAPADVFASADTKNMDKLVAAQVVEAGAPVVFATNRPELAVPAGNPGGVTSLTDLARPELLVGLCAAEVPCGKFARTVLSNAGVTPSIDTNEVDVKALLSKIETGDLDVGIVYHSDVVAAGDKVTGIAIPDDVNVAAGYPIAVLSDAHDRPAAQAFVGYVQAPASQRALAAAGFTRP